MNESILRTLKKLLGVDKDYDVFDADIILHANSAFMVLNDLGVGPTRPFVLTSEETTWSKFFGENVTDFEAVKSYVYIRVRLLFDPPSTSFGQEALKKMAEEYEWRLNVRAEGSYKELLGSDVQPTGHVYDLTGDAEFPEEAPIGAHGVDTETGNFWRKV